MFLYVPPISNWGFPLPQSLTWVHHYPIPNPGSPTSYFSLCYPNPQPMCVPSPKMGSSSPRSHMKSSETGILNVVIDKNHACSRYLRVNSGEKSPGSFIFPRVLFSTHSTHFWKVRPFLAHKLWGDSVRGAVISHTMQKKKNHIKLIYHMPWLYQ